MSRKFKAIGAAVLAAVMCASLAGCGEKDDTGVYVDKDGNISINEKKFEDHVNSVFGGDGGNDPGAASEVSKPEPKPLDPFESLEVEFKGIAPKVTAEIKGQNSNVNYSIDRDGGLKNGDKITVTAKISGNKADEYVLTTDSKEFTVSDRPYYIMELSELTEDDIQKLSEKITGSISDVYIAHAAGGAGTTINSLDFIGNINLTKSGSNYRLYFVYNANVTFANAGTTKDFVYAAFFKNVYKEKDGTVVFGEGKPFIDDLGDQSLSLKGHYVGGAYSSADSVYAQASRFGAELESSVKN